MSPGSGLTSAPSSPTTNTSPDRRFLISQLPLLSTPSPNPSSTDLAVTVLIPAFNEEESISGTVEAIRKFEPYACRRLEIIVINDGSSDRTGEIARTLAR